jgi:hypothetical protein
VKRKFELAVYKRPDGRIEWGDLDPLRSWVRDLPDMQPMAATFETIQEKRSSDANRRYRGKIVPEIARRIAELAGWPLGHGVPFGNPETHEKMKERFLPHIDTVAGTMTGSTADLDTPDFWEFVEKVTAWGIQIGCDFDPE